MDLPSQPLRLGTRASPLALAQADMAATALRLAHGWPEELIEIVPMRTTGDRIQDRALADIGGKALWTKELDRALLMGEIDAAVHSMKDVETVRPAELRIAAMLPRAAVEDRLIGVDDIAALPQGAVVGTSSPRRSAQLQRLRPDLVITLFRGNVATRLGKLEAGEVQATLLAAAGLLRLGQASIGTNISIDTMLPAPAQGAVGMECRADDDRVIALLGPVSDADTFDCVMAERALLAGLDGGCRSPVAALARIDGSKVFLRAEIIAPDGQEHVEGTTRFDRGDNAAPAALAADLLGRSSPALRELFGNI